MRIVQPLNRYERVAVGPDFDLTESLDGCSMRLYSDTVATRGWCGAKKDPGSDDLHLWRICTKDCAPDNAWPEDVLDHEDDVRVARNTRRPVGTSLNHAHRQARID